MPAAKARQGKAQRSCGRPTPPHLLQRLVCSREDPAARGQLQLGQGQRLIKGLGSQLRCLLRPAAAATVALAAPLHKAQCKGACWFARQWAALAAACCAQLAAAASVHSRSSAPLRLAGQHALTTQQSASLLNFSIRHARSSGEARSQADSLSHSDSGGSQVARAAMQAPSRSSCSAGKWFRLALASQGLH